MAYLYKHELQRPAAERRFQYGDIIRLPCDLDGSAYRYWMWVDDSTPPQPIADPTTSSGLSGAVITHTGTGVNGDDDADVDDK